MCLNSSKNLNQITELRIRDANYQQYQRKTVRTISIIPNLIFLLLNLLLLLLFK